MTAALDLLLRQGESISQLVILHSTAAGTEIEQAVRRLEQAGSNHIYPGVTFTLIPLMSRQGLPMADIETPRDGEDSFRALYQAVRGAKQGGLRVHLLAAGGRKPLAMYAMVTAQLLFDEQDRLWYLFSSPAFLASRELHPHEPSDAALVPIPVILWSRISPVSGRLGQVDDPFTAVQMVEELRLAEKMEACRSFVLGVLTPAEERVVRLLVTQGLGDQEIGEELHLSPRTVEQHLRAAYGHAADHWEIDAVNRTQLVSLLSLYYSMEIRGKPG